MDLNTARERLLAHRDRLLRLHEQEIKILDETAPDAEFANYDQHLADAASETFERELELSVIESLEGQLSLVDEALKRIEAGTYGHCEICARPLSEERLAERPMARFCVEHQEEIEKRARAEGDPEISSLRRGSRPTI
jgi:RNA polymerase-binding transcription factor DksA